MKITELDFESLNFESPVVQSRVARLTLAFLTADSLMATDVLLELNLDAEGAFLAYSNLVLALSIGLGEAWIAGRDRDDVIEMVRAQLAALETEEN